jgi:hypothetical protein
MGKGFVFAGFRQRTTPPVFPGGEYFQRQNYGQFEKLLFHHGGSSAAKPQPKTGCF